MHTPLYFYKKLIKSILSNPNAFENDSYIKAYRPYIEGAVSILKECFPLRDEVIFRGVLLGEDLQKKVLTPQKSRQYNSYSCSLNVAKSFANPHDPLSFPLLLMGKKFGYLHKSRTSNSDILYHYKWGVMLNIYTSNLKEFLYQKEVILFDEKVQLTYERVYH